MSDGLLHSENTMQPSFAYEATLQNIQIGSKKNIELLGKSSPLPFLKKM
jgi:hypothetical protein